VHVARAKAMLNIVDESRHETEHKVVGRTLPTRKDPPTFTKPLQNVRVKEGQAIKSVAAPAAPAVFTSSFLHIG